MKKSAALRTRNRGYKELEIRKDNIANALTSVQTDSLVLVTPKSTNMLLKFMKNTSQHTKTMETSPQSTPQLFPTSTSSAADSLVRLSQSLEREEVSTTQEALSFLKSHGLPKPKNLALFSLRTSKDSSPTTTEEPSKQSSPRLMNWGMTFNGKCLTARISESHRIGKECSLSDILEEQVDPKYFLSEKAVNRMLENGYLPTLSMQAIGEEQTEINNKPQFNNSTTPPTPTTDYTEMTESAQH